MPTQRSSPVVFREPTRRWASAPAYVTGIGLLAVSAGLAVSTVIELLYGDPEVVPLSMSTVVVGLVGLAMWRLTVVPTNVGRRDAFLSAVSVWGGISVAGAVPFVLSGVLPRWELALFESVSGFTGTGATVLTPIEGNGHGLLFFRQLTQWYGGMGMVVLAVAVLTFLGIGGMQLLSAEAPGPEVERLAPRVSETAKQLWTVYVVLTLVGAGALLLVGMGPYDAISHSMTGLSTGGFSPHDASIGYFDSVAVEVVIIVIMFVGAIDFALMLRVARRRTVQPLLTGSEFRFYAALLTGSIGFITLVLVVNDHLGTGEALRGAAFNVVSLMTTCGFGTVDYVAWTPAAQLVLLFLMVTGGMAGSTSGAVKLFRVQVALKHAIREIRRVRHPRGVFPIRLGRVPVAERIVTGILAFVMLYFVLAVSGIVLLCLLGADLPTSAGSIATAMGGVGPGLGTTGPASNFLTLNAWQRGVLDLYMLFGRLEILPVLLTGGMLVGLVPGVRRRRPMGSAVPEDLLGAERDDQRGFGARHARER